MRASFACTLDDRGLRGRAAELGRLGRALRGRRLDGGRAVLRFDPDASAAVDRFVAAERACCPFFDIRVAAGDAEVVVTVTVPAGGEPMLGGLVAGLEGGRPRRRGHTLVVAPSDAELTVRAYFASTPRA